MSEISEELRRFITNTEAYLEDMVERMVNEPLPELTQEQFLLFEQTGNRLIYEKEYFAKRKFLTIFGVAALWLTANPKKRLGRCTSDEVLGKLEEVIISVCTEECWALPAHVNTACGEWQNTIDLFAAETAQTLAELVDEVGYGLSCACCEMAMEQVQKRVLRPFFESVPGTYGWERGDNNWNAVCNGSIGSAYLHSLAKNEQPNCKYLQRICNNLSYYIDGFAEDGTCTEGLGYYFYGMTYFVNFAQELLEVSRGRLDLYRGVFGEYLGKYSREKLSVRGVSKEARRRIAGWWSKCYFDSGLTVSFSDGSHNEKYRPGLGCILAQRYEEVRLPSMKLAATFEEDACYRYLPFKLDFFATRAYEAELLQHKSGQKYEQNVWQSSKMVETKNQAEGLNRTHILPEAQWCIAQACMNTVLHTETIGFACKGGHNGESHNHNDVGSFLYTVGNEMFLADLGAGEYTKEYFGNERYNILCNRSLGHNVPLVEGQEQLAGSEYGCSYFEATENETCVNVSMHLEGAYGEERLKSFERNIVFQQKDGVCFITDVFESETKSIITENLVTQLLPKIRGEEVWLEGKSNTCRIQVKPAQLPRIIPMEHSNHQGQKEQVYLMQWDVEVAYCTKVEIHISV